MATFSPRYRPDRAAEKLDRLREALDSHGRDPGEFDVYAMQYVFVNEAGADAAWDRIAEEYLHHRRTYFEYFAESSDSDLNAGVSELDERVRALEDRWRSEAIFGTPAVVREALAAYADAWPFGDLHVIAQLHFPGMA